MFELFSTDDGQTFNLLTTDFDRFIPIETRPSYVDAGNSGVITKI